jgi:hypothetical protein
MLRFEALLPRLVASRSFSVNQAPLDDEWLILHRDDEDLGVISHFLTWIFRCFAPLFRGLSIVVWGSASCFDEGKEMHPLAKGAQLFCPLFLGLHFSMLHPDASQPWSLVE